MCQIERISWALTRNVTVFGWRRGQRYDNAVIKCTTGPRFILQMIKVIHDLCKPIIE